MILTWEDREVRFDLPFSDMHLISGEKIIDRLDNIEDTKGNGGDRGRLIITNLRVLWYSIPSPRISLSIGYGCILAINTKIVNSKLRGATQALHMMTFSNNTRFEFIFTNLVPGNMRHFTSVSGVQKAYISSKPYRELKLRGVVVRNRQLKMLPLEQVFTILHGVWNLSSDQGSPGTFYITNIRIVWFADMNEAFNISLPYLQLESLKVRDSKFGKALVIVCTPSGGGYVLGFRIDPEEKLHSTYKELTSLYTVYIESPTYGVEYKWSSSKTDKKHQPKILSDDVDMEEVEEPRSELSNNLTTYMADEGHARDRPVVYSSDLGLAIEDVKQGFTLQKLWEVIPS